MLVHGELEMIVRFFEGFGLHINGDIPAMEFILRAFFLFLCATGMRKRLGLVVTAGGPPRDSGSVLMDLCLWELCFSLIFPLWELCYSLDSC